MYKGVKTILFPTDLSKNCIPAFDFATLLSLKFQAKIVLLHVKEKLPDYIEDRLEDLLGENKWDDLRHSYENTARMQLIGKQSSNKLIQMALEHFCTENEPNEGKCQPREIVITEAAGPISETIIETAKAHDCDIIVMGTAQGIISKQSVSSTIKSVMKRSAIPVVVVPYTHKLELE